MPHNPFVISILTLHTQSSTIKKGNKINSAGQPAEPVTRHTYALKCESILTYTIYKE